MASQMLTSVEQACDLIRSGSCFSIWAGGTKAGLRNPDPQALALDTRRLKGVIEYEPGEYTITARAGTLLSDLIAVLQAQGQYLPFDPMLANLNATLGGCIAAGISGPGRYRYGGLRDFIIGVRFIDGRGTLVKGGGKVVKNAAGFDFPKLLTGSYGRLGLITEATFKVFPRPQATLSAVAQVATLPEALELVTKLSRLPLDLDALELMPPGEVVVRLSGHAEALYPRLNSLHQVTGLNWRAMSGPAEDETWRTLLHFFWLPGFTRRVRVVLTPARVLELDAELERLELVRTYSIGANVAWIAMPPELDSKVLDRQLLRMKLTGVQLDDTPARIGVKPAFAVERIVKQALDPDIKFGHLP